MEHSITDLYYLCNSHSLADCLPHCFQDNLFCMSFLNIALKNQYDMTWTQALDADHKSLLQYHSYVINTGQGSCSAKLAAQVADSGSGSG